MKFSSLRLYGPPRVAIIQHTGTVQEEIGCAIAELYPAGHPSFGQRNWVEADYKAQRLVNALNKAEK
jgi:hypothetical protein